MTVKTVYETKQWETCCEMCVLCCFEKIEDDSGTIFFTSTPCRYLDIVTRRCKIYSKRFEINPHCIKLTPELVKKLQWLHDGCGYRKMFGLRRRNSSETEKI